MNRSLILAGVLAGGGAMVGCAVVPSATKRAVATGAGAAVGGAAGYGLGKKKPGAILAGAGIGGLLTGLALGDDREAMQSAFDDGYVQGQADAIRRQYFLRQALEAQPLPDETQGKVVHYVLPGPTVTVDGRKLEPHTVTVSVTE